MFRLWSVVAASLLAISVPLPPAAFAQSPSPQQLAQRLQPDRFFPGLLRLLDEPFDQQPGPQSGEGAFTGAVGDSEAALFRITGEGVLVLLGGVSALG